MNKEGDVVKEKDISLNVSKSINTGKMTILKVTFIV